MASPTPKGQPSTNVWVGDLPETIDQEQLAAIFSECGKVESARVFPPKAPGLKQSALVRFSSQDVATWVVDNVNGHLLPGLTEPVVCAYGKFGTPLAPGPGGGPANVKTRLCTHFLANQCRHGDLCSFAHGEHEIGMPKPERGASEFKGDGKKGDGKKGSFMKTKICNHWLAGSCQRGDLCTFAHGEHEIGTPAPPRHKGDGAKGKGPGHVPVVVPGWNYQAASADGWKGCDWGPAKSDWGPAKGDWGPAKGSGDRCLARGGDRRGGGATPDDGGIPAAFRSLGPYDGGAAVRGTVVVPPGGPGGAGTKLFSACSGADLLKSLAEARLLGAGAVPEECQLYVKNLPLDTTDLILYQMFAHFGAIAHCGAQAVLWPDGSCRGYGFVSFLEALPAAQAMMTLNGFTLPSGEALVVCPKSAKED